MNETQGSFEHQDLAAAHPKEMAAIGKTIEAKEVNYSEQGIEKSRRDIVREAVSEARVPAASPAKSAHDEVDVAEKIKLAKKNDQLRYVMTYAAEHGPIKASLLVRNLGDAWLDDQFHDLLLKAHDELVAKKQITEE